MFLFLVQKKDRQEHLPYLHKKVKILVNCSMVTWVAEDESVRVNFFFYIMLILSIFETCKCLTHLNIFLRALQ